MHRINTTFDRPPRELVEEIAGQHVGLAGLEAGPRQVMDAEIKPLDPTWRICGPAFTVRPEMWDDRLISELAPKYVQEGDVIVVDAGGHTDIAVWGMSMTITAKLAGANGAVVDGSCMQSALLVRERPQVPVFCRGVSAAVKGSNHPGSLNIPVICGGVIVYPGDILLGDSDGVVVIRPDEAEQMLSTMQSYQTAARSANDKEVPYYEQMNSEEKVRSFENIEWD